MATQNVVIGANANANEFKCIIYEAATPNTEVQSNIVPLPHTTNQLVSFTGLNLVAHIIRTYEWIGGASLGALIHEYLIQPMEESLKTPEDLQLIVGVDITPNTDVWDGSTAYPLFNGKVLGVDYRVEQRGVGSLTSSEVINSGTFGFSLTGGSLFNDGDTFFIHWFPKIVINPANYTSNNSGGYKDIIEISNNRNVLVADFDKLFDINRTSDIVSPTITLDALSNISDMKFVGFKMDRGMPINAIIKAQFGEIIYFNGQAYNEIYLGQNEFCKIIKKGSAFFVESSNINYNDVGNVVLTTFLDRKGYIFANGSLFGRNTHPRLYNILVSNLTLGNGLINETIWALNNGNKTNFTLGDGVTDFRTPDYRGLYPRFFDGGRGVDEIRAGALSNNVIGNYQDSGNKSHSHDMPTTRDNNSVGEGNGNGIAVAFSGVKQNTALQGQLEVTVKNTTFYAMIKC